MLWLITDTHIGHKNIIKYCDRPASFEKMIFKNWNDMVKSDDTIVHMGDIAWGDDNLKKVIKLSGKKILVKGNHDKKSAMAYMEAGFVLVAKEIRMQLEGLDILISHHPVPEHTADINIHGHQHNLFRSDLTRLYLPLAIEHMGYKPIALDHDFLKELRRWKDTNHIPSVEEIIALKQSYIGHPTEKDLFDCHALEEN